MVVKGKCPVCGWQLSPGAWFNRSRLGRVVGILFGKNDRGQFVASRELKSPGELEVNLKPEDRGLWAVIQNRLVDAVGKLCRWGWLSKAEVLNAVGLYHLAGDIWLDEYERVGARAIERATVKYEAATGQGVEVERRALPWVVERKVSVYE